MGAPDLLATAFEALLVVWAVASIVPAVRSRAVPRGLGTFSTAVVWTAVLATTALVLLGESRAAAGH